jgi:hypothetical protein
MTRRSHLARIAGALVLTLALPAGALAGNAAEDDGVKGFPTLSPFSGVHWSGDTPRVQLGASWYDLVAIDGQPARSIVTFCQGRFHEGWRKRFEEDLVAVLSQMGAGPGETVKLSLRMLDTGRVIEMAHVPMTHENRQAIWRASHGGG